MNIFLPLGGLDIDMKNDENKFLKNKIMINFLLTVLILWLLESLLDEVMNYFDKSSNEISLMLNINQTNFMYISISLYLIISILIFVLSSYIYYRLTSKVLNEESKRRVSEQNMMFAAIAHDLKTPMTSIQGFSRALIDGKVPTDDRESIYTLIYEKAKYTNDLLNTMFEYSKYGVKDYTFKKEEFDLTVLVRNLIADHFIDFEEKNIDIELQISDHPIIVTGDKKELRRAIENVLINSYKHNINGSKVRIGVYTENSYSFVSIADSGDEIPKDFDVFKPFITSNENRTGGKGTGMGLVITKRILEEHGGSIKIMKAAGKYKKEFLLKI